MSPLDENGHTAAIYLHLDIIGTRSNMMVLVLTVVEVGVLTRNGHIGKFTRPLSVKCSRSVHIASISLKALLHALTCVDRVRHLQELLVFLDSSDSVISNCLSI